MLKDRLQQGRERLEEAREAVKALCEPVEPPRDTAAYVRFFCAAESGNAEQLKANEPKRVELYKLTAAFLRAYANLANEMREADYSAVEAQAIKAEVDHYEKVRQEVKLASGDYIDMKVYEPAMRHLLDTYIRAEDSEQLSTFDDMTLVQLIVERGTAAVETLPSGLRQSRDAMAETIENNVRRLIIDERAVNPKYYEKMSELLDALIRQRKEQALDYQAYLAKVVELAKQASQPESGQYPLTIHSSTLRALYDNLRDVQGLEQLMNHSVVAESAVAETAALAVDEAIRLVKKADWRENRFKAKQVYNAIKKVLRDDTLVDRIFEIVKAQRDY